MKAPLVEPDTLDPKCLPVGHPDRPLELGRVACTISLVASARSYLNAGEVSLADDCLRLANARLDDLFNVLWAGVGRGVHVVRMRRN